jgi:hypothetical protein
VETVLNPNAWVDAPLGTFGAQQTYYADFRGQRRPQESLALGKRFAIRERMAFTVRAEFFNIFNRLVSLPDPSTANPQNPPTRNAQGNTDGRVRASATSAAIDSNNQNNVLPAPSDGTACGTVRVLSAPRSSRPLDCCWPRRQLRGFMKPGCRREPASPGGMKMRDRRGGISRNRSVPV